MNYFDRPVVKVNLESDPNLWIELYTEPDYDTLEFFNEGHKADEGLLKLAHGWNLDFPLDLEHIRHLKGEDIDQLFVVMTKLLSDYKDAMEKKKAKTSSSSKPSVKTSKVKPPSDHQES